MAETKNGFLQSQNAAPRIGSLPERAHGERHNCGEGQRKQASKDLHTNM